ncbi:FAD-binding protein [Hahella sp. KA22]|uniref:FAD-binding and (Fe-S)-binding domain-containing protein n=1 Tax=Hahella sp. KA22 TaxID=1628392 RepID=UPI000FDD7ABF|nr:FAD-linked oxidase C-terminal domain-containing protein [Hahella sp. KA22]AZZ94177.1 FAD-binding protein [Hahella sp. KA22]QAY57551.1 FAD-binding protein [Hahella sp. KA22]
MTESFTRFSQAVRQFIPAARVIDDPLRRLAYGTDASFYRLIPQLVLRVENEDEVVRLLQEADTHRIALTFRAAGTSLSGQAVTDSVLVQLQGWREHHIENNGDRIRLQPGVIGAHANRYLAPFQRKIGPDPASINAAKIGGIAANNASGMCCGTKQNSYHTLAHIRAVMADGTVLDTADEGSRKAFAQTHETLLRGVSKLRAEILAKPELAAKIRHKYRLKNTTGYGINALLDFTDPVDILAHLLIGSEGTLGFISSITYNTVADHPDKATALVFFPDIHIACQTVSKLKTSPVAAVELIDRRGLASVQSKPGTPEFVSDLPPGAAALLIETRAADALTLDTQIQQIQQLLNEFSLLNQVPFSKDPHHCAQLWNLRKGLFPALGAARDVGTTVIIEDIAFPIEHLADGVLELQRLFNEYDYPDALIFGHALEGNLHFVFSQEFSSDLAIERYRGLMDAVAQLVAVRFGGSLKAEHGTGRNMAPFVELEWGVEAYAVMRRIKELFDPKGILNPGVIINDDPEAHLRHLKPLPAADPLVDKCIECGFCEPACPSRELTLTPRQRIVASREIARLQTSGEDAEQLRTLMDAYDYAGDDTCAACGLCALSCPVSINTGDLTRLHRKQKNAAQVGKAQWAAEHFSTLTKATRLGLGGADAMHRVLGAGAMSTLSEAARKISGERIPLWHPYLPTAAHSCRADEKAADVVYFSSCASRTMGPARGDAETRSLTEACLRLLEKAGFQVRFPSNIGQLCCGLPFASKGFPDSAQHKAEELAQALLASSEGGRLPIFCDASPCTQKLKEAIEQTDAGKKLKIYDSVEFIHDYVLDRLSIQKEDAPIAIHVTCSAQRMGIGDKLLAIAKRCSHQVVTPEHITCCGFAGDRGFSHPELNASALAPLKAQVQEKGCGEGFSNSRSCEIGLSLHAGVHYHSIVYLVDRVSEKLAGAARV